MKITKLEEETEKRKIADTASSLIRDDMVLFLDSSTTSLHLVRNLARFDGLQIITNGIVTAAMLSEYTTAKYLYWEGNCSETSNNQRFKSL